MPSAAGSVAASRVPGRHAPCQHEAACLIKRHLMSGSLTGTGGWSVFVVDRPAPDHLDDHRRSLVADRRDSRYGYSSSSG